MTLNSTRKSLEPIIKKRNRPVRTLSVHHRLRNGQAGRSSSKIYPTIAGEVAVVFALRTESHVSSSGVKVMSALENTDQRYAL